MNNTDRRVKRTKKALRDALFTLLEQKSINEITVGIDQISNIVQTNSATSQQSAAAAEELAGQANTLKNLIEAFKY